MNYRRDLQIQLRERYSRLYKAHWKSLGDQLGYFVDWITSQPALTAILEAAHTEAGSFDPAEWHEEHFSRRQYRLPPTEAEHAVLVWHLIGEWAQGDPGDLGTIQGAAFTSHDGSAESKARELVEYAIEPLVSFLEERVATGGDVIHLLARFRCRVEWFDRERLWADYQADTSKGEAVYDAALRSYLFDQGIDHPFSQPDSPSGRADVVAGLASRDPLVCEVKLFDGERYTPAYVGQGVGQVVSYASDYGKQDGYLVVFDLTDRHLELPSDDEAGRWPPRLYVQGATVHLVSVRAKPPDEPASRRGKPNPYQISREQLVDNPSE